MSDSNSETRDPASVSTPWIVLVAAVAVAAAPGFFFGNPLHIHMVGEMREYWGIAVFPWAILAGLAFFRDGDFGYKAPHSRDTPVVAAMWLVTFIAIQVAMAIIFERWSSDMAGMRPVDELTRQVPLWAGCGFVAGLFWQGIFQRNFSTEMPAALRVGLTALAGVAVWAPFVLNGGAEVATHLLPAAALGYVLVAVVHEFGAPVWTTMLWHAGFFGGLVWFRQSMLL
jgi:hypothetical protein